MGTNNNANSPKGTLMSELAACSNVLGLETGAIIDSRLTASSELNISAASADAAQARLNNQGAWVAATDDLNQWLKISLYRQINITGVQIQGNPNADQWVTKFKVEGSLGNDIWDISILNDIGAEEIFDGNTDRSTVVSHNFAEPFVAQYIRIRPIEWHGNISTRLELLGCPDETGEVEVGLDVRKISIQ
ncbi:retinoschisin-like [Amphiura filiformis]|uniref:retinoschisin-like n=1 Tax=Amphiura filiformis TaxID=82378 RepID=UPI003B224CBB